MPVIKSAKKKLRADRKRESTNKKIRAGITKILKKAKKNPTAKNIQEAFRCIDKGTKINIFHRNKASHMKSALAKLMGKRPQSSLKVKKAKSVTVSTNKKKG